MATGTDDKTMRGLRLAGIGIVLVIGWGFIAWQNHFHVSPPLVFVMLGYLAVVLTTYNLWRTGAAAVAPGDDEDDEGSWAKPTGALGELDREKRTLLKAIKEAEFDHAMGKLSKSDADQMITTYRARAIEVIKEIEQLERGAAGSVRERILREVNARLALDGKLGKSGPVVDAPFEDAGAAPAKPGKAGKKGKGGKGKGGGGKPEPVTAPEVAPAAEAAPAEAAPAATIDSAQTESAPAPAAATASEEPMTTSAATPAPAGLPEAPVPTAATAVDASEASS